MHPERFFEIWQLICKIFHYFSNHPVVIPQSYCHVHLLRSLWVKFIYSEKATKFCKIFPLLLTTVHTVKSKGKISKNFVAFSEYMNFMVKIVLYFMPGLDWKARTRAGKYQMIKAFLISHKIQRRKTCLKTFRKEGFSEIIYPCFFWPFSMKCHRNWRKVWKSGVASSNR